MTCSDEEINSYLNWLYISPQNLTDQPGIWPFIEAIASELLNMHTLGGKEARAIWEAKLFKEVGKHRGPWSSGYGLRLPFPGRAAHTRNSLRMDRVSRGWLIQSRCPASSICFRQALGIRSAIIWPFLPHLRDASARAYQTKGIRQDKQFDIINILMPE